MRVSLRVVGAAWLLAACNGSPAPTSSDEAGTDVSDVLEVGGDVSDALDVGDAPSEVAPMDVRPDVAVCVDDDGDGYPATECGGMPADCNDRDSTAHPGAPEVCDRRDVDEDCDPCTVAGTADGDQDHDTFVSGQCGNTYRGPAPTCGSSVRVTAGTVNGTDCDDSDPNTRPNQTESCNNRDDNCDGRLDEGITTNRWFRDNDRDGHGDPRSVPVESCANPSTASVAYVTSNDDCEDADAFTYRGAEERCDGRMRDENCDGTVDEGCACSEGASRSCETAPGVRALGVCAAGTQTCVRRAMGAGAQWGACSIQPGIEVCNGVDDDCDGSVDEPSTIPAGVTPPPNAILDGRCGTLLGGACLAGACRCSAGQESCGGTCRETGATCSVGVGACTRSGRLLCSGTNTACSASTGMLLTPGAPAAEVCNDLDDDCDSSVDEDLHVSNSLRLGGESTRLCDGQYCSAVAHSACSTAPPTAPLCQANTGVAIYMGGDNVFARCLALPITGPRAVPVHQRSSYEFIARGYATACNSTVTDRVGLPCFNVAHTWCVASGYTTGFLSRDGLSTGGQGEVFITCLRPEHVELRTGGAAEFPRTIGCDLFRATPDVRADYCGRTISGLCTRAGFVDGWGPIALTATEATYACIKRF